MRIGRPRQAAMLWSGITSCRWRARPVASPGGRAPVSGRQRYHRSHGDADDHALDQARGFPIDAAMALSRPRLAQGQPAVFDCGKIGQCSASPGLRSAHSNSSFAVITTGPRNFTALDRTRRIATCVNGRATISCPNLRLMPPARDAWSTVAPRVMCPFHGRDRQTDLVGRHRAVPITSFARGGDPGAAPPAQCAVQKIAEPNHPCCRVRDDRPRER
jgi:hypothetical protein